MWLHWQSFLTNAKGYPCLSKRHQRLMAGFFNQSVQVFLHYLDRSMLKIMAIFFHVSLICFLNIFCGKKENCSGIRIFFKKKFSDIYYFKDWDENSFHKCVVAILVMFMLKFTSMKRPSPSLNVFSAIFIYIACAYHSMLTILAGGNLWNDDYWCIISLCC